MFSLQIMNSSSSNNNYNNNYNTENSRIINDNNNKAKAMQKFAMISYNCSVNNYIKININNNSNNNISAGRQNALQT